MKEQDAVANSVEGAVCGLIPARSPSNATRLGLNIETRNGTCFRGAHDYNQFYFTSLMKKINFSLWFRIKAVGSWRTVKYISVVSNSQVNYFSAFLGL